MKNLPDLAPPPVTVSPEVDWLLQRAFGKPDQELSIGEGLDGDLAVEQGKMLALLPRVRSRSSRKTVESDLGESAADSIDRMRHQVAASAMRHEEVCHQIAELAREPEIPIIFLKGMTLQLTGVTPPGSRVIGDIDVLVPGNRAETLQQLLLDAGSKPSGLRGSDQHLSVVTHTLGAPIEVHHRLRGVDLGQATAATAEQCLESGQAEVAPGLPDHCYVTSQRLTVAYLLVHALSLHGRAPAIYPGFHFLADLQDLGYSPIESKQIPEESLQWISDEVRPELVEAAMTLLGRLETGEKASEIAVGGYGAGTLLRHLLAGAFNEEYRTSLKLSNQLQTADGELRADWPTRVWRAFWLTPTQIDILYGKPKTRLGYVGWQMWRPFHLVGKTMSSARARMKLRRKRR